MKLIDIQHSISKLIGDVDEFKDFDIIPGSNSEHENIETPSFIVNVRGPGTTNYVDYKHKVVNVTLYYVNKEYDHLECMNIQDMLEDVFIITLKVNDRFLVIENINWSEDECLICNFTLKFNDDNNIKKKTYYKMESFDIDL